jgi:CheY-like chemotaxis protein
MTCAAPLEKPATSDADELRGFVLYVEDHPVDVALMADFLSGFEGLSFAAVTSIEDAGEVARRTPPSVVLMDVDLLGEPGGSDALARLLALREMRAVPLIGLSGTAHPRARELARHLGFDRFVAKPLDLTELGRALASVLPAAE